MRGRLRTSCASVVLGGLALAACASLKPRPAPPAAPLAETPAEAPAATIPPPIVHIIPPPPKVSCVPKTLPHTPKYPDTDAALKDAGGAADRYQLMAAGRLLRLRRLAELEKAIDACR